MAYSDDRRDGTFFVLFLFFALILLFTFISICFLLLRFFPPIVCYFYERFVAMHLIFNWCLRVLLLFRRYPLLFIFFHNNQTKLYIIQSLYPYHHPTLSLTPSNSPFFCYQLLVHHPLTLFWTLPLYSLYFWQL